MPRSILRPSVAMLLALGTAGPAAAAVVAAGPTGFVLHLETTIAREPGAAWTRLTRTGEWWSPAHTYSHDAANLSLALEPGGCWCERLPEGGFVRHMEVVYAAPGTLLRLAGGLGPLQAMGVNGALSFTLKPAAPGHTAVSADYVVSGYAPHGFESLATVVDGVLAEQLARYATP
jgi:hypothetical protein